MSGVYHYGPWSDYADVEDFMRDNSGNFSDMMAFKLLKAGAKSSIHPNQTQIGDYIDPSVAQ